MGEPVVATVMTCPAVAVTPNTKFKDVVNALLAGDGYAVPVVDSEARPLGMVSEVDLLANLEFHGGTDAVPIFGGAAVRRRWRKASALTAAELMAAPVAVIGADAPIGPAVRTGSSSKGRVPRVDGLLLWWLVAGFTHAHVTSRRRSVVGRWWAAQPWQAGLLCGGEGDPLSVAETGAHVERSRWRAREVWVALGGSLVTFGFRSVELRA